MRPVVLVARIGGAVAALLAAASFGEAREPAYVVSAPLPSRRNFGRPRPRWRKVRKAHAWGPKPPTNGAREIARRTRQVAAGQLRAANGYVGKDAR